MRTDRSFIKYRACHRYSSPCRKHSEGGKDVPMREHNGWADQDISGRKCPHPPIDTGCPTALSSSTTSSKRHTNTNLAMLSWANTDLVMSHLLCASSLHAEGRHHLPVGAAETRCWESSGAPRGEKDENVENVPQPVLVRRILQEKHTYKKS